MLTLTIPGSLCCEQKMACARRSAALAGRAQAAAPQVEPCEQWELQGWHRSLAVCGPLR